MELSNLKGFVKCQYFIYDKEEDYCKLFSQDLYEFDDTCKKIGGPGSPHLDDCPWRYGKYYDCQVSKIGKIY